MTKKTKSVDLTDKNIEYTINENKVKMIRFNHLSMTVDINIYSEGRKARGERIPFAQLPKHIKRVLKPL